MKGGLMGEPYLLLKIEETAHLPVLAVQPLIKCARGENNNA
jgi:hypothetical protein